MTNRQHCLNLYRLITQRFELVLMTQERFPDEEMGFINKAILDKRILAEAAWLFAENEFRIFLSYMKVNHIKLDDEMKIQSSRKGVK